MKIIKYLIFCIALSLLILCCGKNDSSKVDDNKVTNTIDKKITKVNNTKYSNYQVDKDGNRLPEIKAVTFVGKPFENTDLKADVHFSILSDNIELKFQWVVNDKIVAEENSGILSKEKFKQGDWVFCKVRIVDKDLDTNEVKSKYIKILGLTPILDLDPVPEMKIPGEFRYMIKAYLPGQNTDEENTDDIELNVFDDFSQDKGLEFSLISPTDIGIFIDPDSGEIIWNISEDIASSLKELIEIKFKVSNPTGGFVISSIKLSFSTSEIKETGKGSSLGTEIE